MGGGGCWVVLTCVVRVLVGGLTGYCWMSLWWDVEWLYCCDVCGVYRWVFLVCLLYVQVVVVGCVGCVLVRVWHILGIWWVRFVCVRYLLGVS